MAQKAFYKASPKRKAYERTQMIPILMELYRSLRNQRAEKFKNDVSFYILKANTDERMYGYVMLLALSHMKQEMDAKRYEHGFEDKRYRTGCVDETIEKLEDMVAATDKLKRYTITNS